MMSTTNPPMSTQYISGLPQTASDYRRCCTQNRPQKEPGVTGAAVWLPDLPAAVNGLSVTSPARLHLTRAAFAMTGSSSRCPTFAGRASSSLPMRIFGRGWAATVRHRRSFLVARGCLRGWGPANSDLARLTANAAQSQRKRRVPVAVWAGTAIRSTRAWQGGIQIDGYPPAVLRRP
jgi:hypothetical protein